MRCFTAPDRKQDTYFLKGDDKDMKQKKIVMENGREFYGEGFGADRESVAELVFNTSIVGYQEVLSDLSYTGQIVVMTYPLIGNYGVNDDDYESKFPSMSGMVVHEYNDSPSNFRYTKTLSEAMEDNNIPGISGVDTREIRGRSSQTRTRLFQFVWKR